MCTAIQRMIYLSSVSMAHSRQSLLWMAKYTSGTGSRKVIIKVDSQQEIRFLLNISQVVIILILRMDKMYAILFRCVLWYTPDLRRGSSNHIKLVFTTQTCTMHHNIDNLWFSITQKTIWKPICACMLYEYYLFGQGIRYWVMQLMCMSWIHLDKVIFLVSFNELNSFYLIEIS